MASAPLLLYSDGLSSDQFRLMRFIGEADKSQSSNQQTLLFDLQVTSLDHAPLYDTLSYRWEDPDPQYPESRVICNNIEIHVGRNLYLALSQVWLMSDRPEYIWVDCICIDQINLSEKQTQILNMAQIYSRAHRVIIWLGPASETEGSDEAMEFFPYLVDLLDLAEGPRPGEPERLMTRKEIEAGVAAISNWCSERDPRTKYVWSLLNRAWFSRAWTLQEAAVASQNCTVLCGDKTMPYSVLQHFADRVISDEAGLWSKANSAIRPYVFGSDPENPYRPPIAHLITVLRMRRAWFSKSTATSTVRVLNLLRLLDCTNPADRVLSASAFLPQQLVASLRAQEVVSTTDLYIKYAEIELGKTQNLRCLSAAGLCQQQRSYPSRYPAGLSNPLLKLPSWVPDWTYRKINQPLWVLDQDLIENRGEHLYRTATDVSPEVRITTHVDGSAVASVRGVLVGDVFACLEPYRIYMIPHGTVPEKQPECLLDMMLSYKTQIEEFVSHGREHLRIPKDASPSDQLTAIRQTLTGSMIPLATGRYTSNSLTVRSRPEQIELMFEDFEENVLEIRELCERVLNPPPDSATEQVSAEVTEAVLKARAERATRYSLTSAAAEMCKGRRAFAVSNGSIGVGPDISVEGDKICVLYGSCTPFVIRKVTGSAPQNGETYYQLVGECYVHGLMDGEVLSMEGLVPEDILFV